MKKRNSMLLRVLGLVVGFFILAGSAAAQSTQGPTKTVAFTENLNNLKVRQDANPLITLELDQVPLNEALKRIAGQAEAGLYYNAALLPDKTVSLHLKAVPLDKALRKVLKGTTLRVVTAGRNITLRPKRKKNQLQGPLASIQETITGTVTDGSTENTLPGVNIGVKGTTTGTSTDIDGNYSLVVESLQDTLVFSFVGYQTRQVPIKGRTTLDVSLKIETITGEELVVVGYGTQRRENVTGSMASINSEDLQSVAVTSFDGAIQGKLAGVNVATTSGAPGSSPQIRIRGTGSISAGNNPLFVVDGLPLPQTSSGLQDKIQTQNQSFSEPTFNPLSAINPSNIKSIEVLKDAASTAIYGSRGSNGVVLITTKGGGFNMPPQIDIDTRTGVQTVFNRVDLMNAKELIKATEEGRNNLYLRERDPLNPNSDSYNPNYDPNTNAGREEFSDATTNMLIPEMYINWDGTDTDWLDEVLQPAITHETDFSIRGGGSDIAYYVGPSYTNQGGLIKGSDFKRYAINTGVRARLTDKFQVDIKLNSAYINNNRKPANGPYFGNPAGIIYSAMVATPVAHVYDEDGNYLQSQLADKGINSITNGGTTINHPLALRDYIDETLTNTHIFGNLSGTYSIIKNLQFKSKLGFDVNNYQQSFYQGTKLLYRGADDNSSHGQSSASQSFNWIWENTLNYNIAFGNNDKHSINAVVGYSAQKEGDELNRVVAQDYPDDNVKTINAGKITGGTQRIEEWSLVSAYGRINYAFLDRYLLTATIRSDRSSRFGKNNQTAVFPSISIGWRLKNEPFMQNIDLFSQIKPRISYGVTGNSSIPNYGSVGLISSTYYVRNDLSSAAIPTTLGDDNLTWETTREFNMGLDIAILNDQIYGSFDYYISNTNNLLLNVNIPSATGFENTLTNVGKVENRGFEFQISSRNLTTESFNWTTSLNFSTNSNKVKKLGPEGDPILSEGAAGIRHITKIGSPIGSYWGYVQEGIFQSQEEIDNAPVDKVGSPTPGDIRFKDLNGDGVIDTEDRTVIGSYQPDFQWGITNKFNWKGFDMSIFIQGVQGRDILNLTGRHLLDEANVNLYDVPFWESPEKPGNGYYPKITRADPANNSRISSFLVQDASYIRIKDLKLGYSIPSDILGDFAKKVHIYGSVDNVAIWTDYIGWNPEVNLQSDSPLTPGEDYGAYPLHRTIQFGIDVSL